MPKDVRVTRIKELICKILSMSVEEYNTLTEEERHDLQFDMYYLLSNMKEGKSYVEALQLVKARNPNYRKEIERYQIKREK